MAGAARRCLEGKIAVITGGATGIGYKIAESFLQKGAKTCVLVDVLNHDGQAAAEVLTGKFGKGKGMYIKCDVRKDLERVTKQIYNELSYVDILVNNAGVLDDTRVRRCIDVNLRALIEWSLKYWDRMCTMNGGRGGTILNISSTYGYRIDPFLPVFQASQFGILGFSKSLGHKYNYDRSCVRVLTLNPGYTYTRMTEELVIRHDEYAKDDYMQFLQKQEWQKAQAVADAAVEIFEKADTSTAWVIEGARPIYSI